MRMNIKKEDNPRMKNMSTTTTQNENNVKNIVHPKMKITRQMKAREGRGLGLRFVTFSSNKYVALKCFMKHSLHFIIAIYINFTGVFRNISGVFTIQDVPKYHTGYFNNQQRKFKTAILA